MINDDDWLLHLQLLIVLSKISEKEDFVFIPQKKNNLLIPFVNIVEHE